MISYLIAKITYSITWIPWYLLFKIFLRYEIVYKDRRVRKLRGPLIIAANHSSWLDPFLVSGIFPIFSPIFPIRFATHYRFFYYIYTALFVRLYGCFRIRKGIGLGKVLAKAVSFLEKNQVVGIFPEGRQRHFGRPRKGRRGATYLAIKTSSRILPCYIDGTLGLKLKSFLFRKRKIIVYVGYPFLLSEEFNNVNNIDQLNKATDVVIARIRELHASRFMVE